MVNGKAATVGVIPALSPRHWASLRTWHDEHGRHHLPWRVVSTPWKVLLAEVLLHRTRATAVEKLYDEALSKFPGPKAIVRRPADWLQTTRPVGLAWRAQLFISTCDSLVALHRSSVPSGWTDLTSLPGIGHYIASTVRCFGFGSDSRYQHSPVGLQDHRGASELLPPPQPQGKAGSGRYPGKQDSRVCEGQLRSPRSGVTDLPYRKAPV